MQLFGGGRKIVYSEGKGNIIDQVNQCLAILSDFIDDQQLYPGCFIRHNVFINVEDNEAYNTLKKEIVPLVQGQFPLPQLVNVIAQAPNKHDVAIESGYIDHANWNAIYKNCEYGSCQWLKSKEGKFAFGRVQCHDFDTIKENSEVVFKNIEKILGQFGFTIANIVRQWNYVEHLLEYDNKVQRYQAFNDVRSEYYQKHFNKETGYPAATGIGMRTGGVIVEFLAMEKHTTHSTPIDNPRQRAAHQYTDKVLPGSGTYISECKSTPKFERARSVKANGHQTVFISGTAAITGENSIALDNVVEQTHVTIENIKHLIAAKNLKDSGLTINTEPTITKLRVYVKHRKDFEAVEKFCDQYYSDADCLVIKADICRDNLLVEIEGEAMV